MKLRILVVSCVTLLVMSLGALYIASSMFRDVTVGHRSISLLRHAFERSDHIEVQFLSSDPPTRGQKVFKPADYYGESYTIVSFVRLDDRTTKELKCILSGPDRNIFSGFRPV